MFEKIDRVITALHCIEWGIKYVSQTLQSMFNLGSCFGFCVVSEHIQASCCIADRPLAVQTGLADPDPVTRSGKNKHGGRYLNHTHYKLLNLGALEVSLVNKMFHL